MSCRHSGAGVRTLRRRRGRGQRGGPAAGADGGCVGGGFGGRSGSPAGASRFRFLSGSPPPRRGVGRPPGGRDCSLPGLRPPRPASLGRARDGHFSPPFSPPHWSGSLPLPSPKMAARPRRWEGDCIRRPPLALPFFPSQPFLLRLDAPPHPQPSRAGGCADGRRTARPSGADSIILQHQRHLLGRPPASPAG